MNWYSPQIVLLIITIIGMIIWFIDDHGFEPLIAAIGGVVALSTLIALFWQKSLTNGQEAFISILIIVLFGAGLFILHRHGLSYPSIIIGLLISVGIIALIFSVFIPSFQTTTLKSNNHVPIVHGVRPNLQTLQTGDTIIITAIVTDEDNDPLQYVWQAQRGTVPQSSNPGSVINYTAPSNAGMDTITLTVSDNKGGTATERTNIAILSK